MYYLQTPITDIKGIGPTLSKKFLQANIKNVGDLLILAPLRYEHRESILEISSLLTPDKSTLSEKIKPEIITIQAIVLQTSQSWRGNRSFQRATVADRTGQLKLTWFNSPFIIRQLQKGQTYNFSGKWSTQYKSITQATIERDTIESIHTGRIVSIYSSKLGIKSGMMRRILHEILTHLESIPDNLYQQLDWCQLRDITHYLSKLHFPDSSENAILARKRLALEELLILIQNTNFIQQEWQKKQALFSLDSAISIKKLNKYIQQLPFKLTTDQINSLSEIINDLQQDHPMNRLLQGDVGVGKTIVIALAAQLLIEQRQSVCLIAPTKILANQHLASISKQLPQLPIELITSTNNKLASKNSPTLFVGTHALINKIDAIKPALIVFDEQQRFGVDQRGYSHQFNFNSHILTMTATPIPRSLMLTIFSHLSLSQIKTVPKGRQVTKTWYIPKNKQGSAWQWIADQISQSEQLVLVVCPFIEDSNSESAQSISSAESTYSLIKKQFPQLKIGLLHGKLSPDNQSKIINNAHAGELNILVATSIIEVGVDLPQASIMIILSAERFGLASLHQLRGRVGRRNQQGYCLLMSDSLSPNSISRIKNFAKINSGIEVAELDLSLRGPGNLLGVEQHGFELFQFASWVDQDLLYDAQALSPKISKTWQSVLIPLRKQIRQVAQN